MADWRNWYQEAANSKPLFKAIYVTVIIGILVSTFYVFSAINSSKSPTTASSTTWLSAPSTDVDSSHLSLTPTFSRTTMAMGATPPPVSQPRSNLTKPIWEIPKSKKMPPLETFLLTKELLAQRAEDNVIIMTFGNYAFMDFILTWVKHLTDLGLSNLIVGAMDTKLVEALYWKGVPVFDMGSHMSTLDVGWGSPTFHKMGREKAILIDSVLPFGFELLMCDTDMVWLKNPLPFLARYPDADILTSSDSVEPTVIDDRLDIWQQVGAAYNVGIFLWRPTESAKKLAKEWKEMLLADDKIWDQNGFNDLVRRQLGPSVSGDSGLAYAYDGNLKLGILPASIFCSGHTHFVQAMYQQLRLEPYAVHTTFQYAGTEGKRHRLREGMYFYDPPEYYDSPGGFLSFKPSIPKSLLLDGEHNLESHFALVNYQMKQIRTALAIASLLNRTLVMPKLWCRLDRLWFGHPGVLVGSMTRQPFVCPLDHVFEINVMLQELPVEDFGPGISIREYSFFDNPSVPKQVKESWLEVHLCQDGVGDCHASNNTTRPGILRFPRHSSEEMFKTVFSSFKDVKVIQFSSMQDAFTGFTDKTRDEKFRKRVKRYVGIWCCVENRTPGHIYYDMYWDEKPGWKPIPPQKSEDDHPPW
ncbi:arabinosyltransferase XEG113-like isoform X2 [Mangifera indica]|uniref:arabinosyltransferase XEG113-like isoform X2 n=1 Tax=Mangifera indica TaxID=29780 RepID=UPI001CF968CF|nr:arabinosyltransferase XEG113-like isoform X2 [Mangifera indica]